MSILNVLAIGDVVGKPGRTACRNLIPKLRAKYNLDFVMANGENIAAGSGVTADTIQELLASGIDLITLGDHAFKKKEGIAVIANHPLVLRPFNYPKEVPGQGLTVITLNSGVRVAVLNLMGRVFLQSLDCPFRAADQALSGLDSRVKVILLDFHAEATSEKVAMGWFLDGRASAVLGTHTHIQTADETVLPKGTAYITELGMTGPYRSVIGRDTDQVIHRFLTQMPGAMEVASGDIRLAGVLVQIDSETGRAKSIRRIHEKLNADE